MASNDIKEFLRIEEEFLGVKPRNEARPSTPVDTNPNAAVDTNPNTAVDTNLQQTAPVQEPANDIKAFQQIAEEFDPASGTFLGDLQRGIRSGLEQIVQTPRTLAAVFTGDKEKLAEIQGEIAVAPQPSVTDIQDVDSFGAFTRYLAGLVGQNLPLVPTAFIGGGAGALIGRGLASRFLTRAAADKLAARAAVAGATGAFSAIEGAGTAQEIFSATGDIRPLETTIAGIAKGALETLTPALIARRLGILSDDAAEVLGRAVKKIDEIANPVARRLVSVAGATLTEGATEAVQEAVDIAVREYVDENFDIFSPETVNRLINAFAGGALVGAVFGGAGEGINAFQEKLASLPDRTETEIGAPVPQIKARNDPGKTVAVKIDDQFLVGDPNVVAAVREALDPKAPIFEVDTEAIGDLPATVLPKVTSRDPEQAIRIALGLEDAPKKSRDNFSGQLAAAVVKEEDIAGAESAFVPISRISLRKGDFKDFDTPRDKNLLFTAPSVVDEIMQLYDEGNVTVEALNNAFSKIDPEFEDPLNSPAEELKAKIDEIARRVDPNVREEIENAVNKTVISLVGESDNPKVPLSPIVDIGNIRVETEEEAGRFTILRRIEDRQGNLIKGFEAEVNTPKKRKLIATIADKGLAAIRKIAPDLNFVLGVEKLDSATRGVAITQTEPKSIFLSSELIRRGDIKETSTVFAHELGHLLMAHIIKKDQGELLSLLREAYANFLMKASFNSKLGEFTAGELLNPDAVGVESEVLRGFTNSGYFRSFAEWFARQFAKFAVSKPETFQDEIFARLAKKVRTLFKELSKDINIDPDETFSTFVEHLSEILNTEDLMENAHRLESPDTTADVKKMIDVLNVKKHDKTLDSLIKEALEKGDFFNKLVKWGFTIEQLAIKNPHIEPLQRYVQFLDAWATLRSRWLARATETLRAISRLSRKQLTALTDLTFALDEMVYLSDEEKKNNVVRQPTEEEFAELVKEFGVDEAALSVYNKMNSDFSAVLDFMEVISIRDAEETIQDPEALQAEIQNIQAEFAAMRSRPYFPHTRFGQFVVTVRDKDGRIVFSEQTETERQAKRLKAELEKVADKEDAISIGKLPESTVPFMGIPAPLLRLIRDKLSLDERQKEALDEIIVAMSPERSFRRRFLRRKNIAGYSTDLPRVYSQYFLSAANFLARIAFQDKLQQAVNDTRSSAVAIRRAGGNSVKRDGIADFLQDHLNALLSPANDWAALRSLAAIWYLGFNAKAAFVNFTQVPLVAWPYLSARFSNSAAAGALKRALKELKLLYTNPERFVKELKGVDRKMFEEAFTQNFLDESLATELAQVAENSALARLGGATKTGRMLSNFNSIAMAFFQTAEKINRRVVFKAAYDLALKHPNAEYLKELKTLRSIEFERLLRKGFTEQEAAAFLAGKDAVVQTQFKYSKENRPRFMRGKAGTILTFFMFTQNMLFTFFNTPGNTRMILLLLFSAGLMGLPGAEDIMDLVKFTGRKLFGKNFDPEIELRRILVSIFGNDSQLPDYILHGAGRNSFGLPHIADMMGIPFPQVDLSRSLSFGRIVPGLEAVTAEGDGDARFSRAVTDMAGAAFGVGINIYKALTDSRLSIDDYKRWERAMPRAIANVTKAVRFVSEGRERNRAGATVIEFDPTDPQDMLDISAQLFGFTPTRLSRRYDRDAAMQEATTFWLNRRSILMLQVMHAVDTKDPVVIRDAMDAVRRFNRTVPFPSLALNRKQLVSSIKNRLRSRTLQERGIPNARLLIPVAEDIKSLFPEVEAPGVRKVVEHKRAR